ncbi:MAG: GNAT family N-acetyltransferase [Pseudomonadota bacterium]
MAEHSETHECSDQAPIPSSSKQIADIQIVEYEAKYQTSFKKLNEEWITQWFKMEEADHLSLNSPQAYICDNGGHILIALCNGEPVGTCALIKINSETYELAKMSVSTQCRGQGVGLRLGQEMIAKAKKLGAKRLYLESNTILTSAINLYHKLGFKEVKGALSPYERCNIQMECILE